MNTESTPLPATAAVLPSGISNAYIFAVFNALSFQMILSSPMVLYAKSLGASATVLGVIAGMMPLLVIFQIPAASHVSRVGYKRFVYNGWGIRVLFICFMTLVPLTAGFLNETTRLALLLLLLFGFNLSRGISSCAWLPWITSIIPESLRGRYLAREAAFVNISSSAAFLLAALCLGGDPQSWQFSVIFGFSASMGMLSLIFLKRIPEGETPEENRVSTTPVPWIAIGRHPAFRKLLRMNIAWSIAYGGLTAFVVAFLKTEARLSEQTILLVTAVSFIGGLGSMWLLETRLDRIGSKPVLHFSFLTWLGILVGWSFLSSKLISTSFAVVLLLQLLMGWSQSMVTMANTRLAMLTIPPMGRNHFFALFSVVGNLTQGIAPILWGVMIDALNPLHTTWGPWEWNRFSVFFLAVGGVFLAAIFFNGKLEEPRAVKSEDLLREILRSPLRFRFWLRFWPRS